jgi:hypothetical protein
MPTGVYPRQDIKTRLLSGCFTDPASGCWIWTRKLNSRGYASTWFEGKTRKASRVAFFVFKGHWPEDKALHDCDNPKCINPDHLHDGTTRQNAIEAVDRGLNANSNKTHCKRGHALTGDNVRWSSSWRSGRPQRTCRDCERLMNGTRRSRPVALKTRTREQCFRKQGVAS